ncbi:MAG: NAD(P)H-dependent glycerol-3-phosphate dehydrogenase [bacterium]|nr:NAD(P)H-dependent glycerol-3-phosphate dehydrogenase [candidate division KSB1 bacterium]MDH7560177.1 NAD(P)H-dependent glycerol-3-phosphate dehydrogenase [bacterium]
MNASTAQCLKVAVIGAGGWGTALAILLHGNGHEVCLWEFRPEVAEELARTRENRQLLPGVPIPEEILITADLEEAATGAELVVVAVPSHTMREVARRLRPLPAVSQALVVSATKGIENESLMRMTEVLLAEMPELEPRRVVALSGPSHAEEVSRGISTAVVCACPCEESARLAQRAFMNKTFRVYTSTDVIGVELGGALKNVIAIAAGICDGAGFGDNTKAALQPRGLVEIVRLGVKMGANPLTFAGLTGMGDLIVTCMSKHSRNRYLGEQIGKGKALQQVLSEMVMVAEGVRTTRSAYELSRLHNVEMPITREVYRILFEGKDPRAALEDLMTRDAKMEAWG